MKLLICLLLFMSPLGLPAGEVPWSDSDAAFIERISSGGVKDLALSPDGRYLGVAQTSTAGLWDLAEGHYRRLPGEEIPGDAEPTGYESVTFSQQGALLAYGGRKIQIYDLTTAQLRHTLEPDQDVGSLMFSPDGKVLASAGKVIDFWDPVTGKHLGSLDGYAEARLYSIAFSPDGTTLAAGYMSGHVVLWDWPGKKLRLRLKHENNSSRLAFSHDGQTLVCRESVNIVIWDLPGRRVRRQLKGYDFDLTSDGKEIAYSYGFEKDMSIATIQSMQTGEDRVILKGALDWILDMAFSPDGNRLFTGSQAGEIIVWSRESGKPIALLLGLDESTWLAWDADGTFESSIYQASQTNDDVKFPPELRAKHRPGLIKQRLGPATR